MSADGMRVIDNVPLHNYQESPAEQTLDNAADGSDAASQGRCKSAPAAGPSAVEELQYVAEFLREGGSHREQDICCRAAEELDRLRAENEKLRGALQSAAGSLQLVHAYGAAAQAMLALEGRK
jgi:hypothetical protein